MPNHFHLMIRTKVINGISENEQARLVAKSFKDFLISYSKAINKKYDRIGSLFQAGFKRKEIDNDFYFSWLIQYIHYNPIKANLCKRYEDWKYSSYNAIAGSLKTSVLREEVLSWFGGGTEFVRVHKERLIDEARLNEYLFDD